MIILRFLWVKCQAVAFRTDFSGNDLTAADCLGRGTRNEVLIQRAMILLLGVVLVLYRGLALLAPFASEGGHFPSSFFARVSNHHTNLIPLRTFKCGDIGDIIQ